MASDAFSSLRTPASDQLIYLLVAPSQPLYFACLGLIIAVLLSLHRHRLALRHWGSGLAGALFTYGVLQLFTAESTAGHLTPDGRTLLATVPLGLLAVISAPAFSKQWRWIVYAACAIASALAIFGNLYLGQSTLTSSITGALISSVWVAGLGVAYRTHTQQTPTRRQSAHLLIATAVLPIAIGWLNSPEPNRHKPSTVLTNPLNWQQELWRELPHIRNDLQASSKSPLNLQYAGNLDWLQQQLHKHDWIRVNSMHYSDALKLLSPSLPLAELPVLPHIHNGEHDSVVWLRPGQAQRWVIRLWPTQYALSDEQPIWLGEVSSQIRRSRLGIFNYAVTSDNFPKALALLSKHIPLTHQRLKPDGTLLISAQAFSQSELR